VTNRQTGAVLFTINLHQIAQFYQRVVGMTMLRSDDDHIVLPRNL
jgi:catechol-2,3-dioxygenase